LCVDIRGIDDIDQRVAVADLRTRWDADPKAVSEEFAASEAELRGRIGDAMRRCSAVEVSGAVRRMIACLCISLRFDGHRADLVPARTTHAIAAYNDADAVDSTHVAEVAEMVYALVPRATGV
jgi:Mg-chelatase subunit ChlI